MSDVSGIPNLGIPGMSGFNGGGGVNGIPGSNGLNNAYAQQAQNNAYFANQARTMQAAQVPQSQLYGGGSFGAQPAHYAGVGAAYGRGTGGFNAVGGVTQPVGGGGGSVFDTGAPAVPHLSGGGMPFGGGGFSNRGTSVFDTGTSGIPNLGGGGGPFGGGGFSPGAQPSFNDRFAGGGGGFNAFDPGIYAPSTGFGLTGRGGLGGASAQAPPLTGQPPDMSDPDAPSPGGSSVHVRGMNPQASVPYQYAGGQAFPGAGIGSNQPTNMRDRIANIMSGSQGNQLPIMGAGADDGGDGGGGGFRGVTSGAGSVGAPEGGFNSYGLPGGGGIGAFGGRGGLTTGIGTTGGPLGGERSPFTSEGFTQPSYAPSWQTSIPPGRGLPAVTKSVYDAAAQHGYDPAALAGVIGVESGWDPRNNTGAYFGMTQMGPGTFKDAGGRLGGLTFDQYKGASAPQQVGAYGDWLNTGAQNRGSAASMVTGGIGSLPPPMQAAIMQGTQFGPNSTGWPAALGQGNVSMRTTPSPQAQALGDTSIGAMNNYFDRTMSRWPTNQKWGPY